MNKTPLELNSKTLEAEMRWLEAVIQTRMDLRFGEPITLASVYEVPMPKLEDDTSFYARIVLHCGFGFKERLVMALSLAPHVKPQVLDHFFLKNKIGSKL